MLVKCLWCLLVGLACTSDIGLSAFTSELKFIKWRTNFCTDIEHSMKTSASKSGKNRHFRIAVVHNINAGPLTRHVYLEKGSGRILPVLPGTSLCWSLRWTLICSLNRSSKVSCWKKTDELPSTLGCTALNGDSLQEHTIFCPFSIVCCNIIASGGTFPPSPSSEVAFRQYTSESIAGVFILINLCARTPYQRLTATTNSTVSFI